MGRSLDRNQAQGKPADEHEAGGGEAPNPQERLPLPEPEDAVRLPGQGLHPVAGLIALPEPVEVYPREVQAVTIEEDVPGSDQGVQIAEPPLLPIRDGEPQDPLAQGGAEKAQLQRLQQEQQPKDRQGIHNIVPAVPEGDILPEDCREKNHPEKAVCRKVDAPGQEAADGGCHLGLHILLGQVQRPAGTAGELVEIALGVQVLIADLSLPQLPADGLRLAECRPLLGDAGEPPGHQFL